MTTLEELGLWYDEHTGSLLKTSPAPNGIYTVFDILDNSTYFVKDSLELREDTVLARYYRKEGRPEVIIGEVWLVEEENGLRTRAFAHIVDGEVTLTSFHNNHHLSTDLKRIRLLEA